MCVCVLGGGAWSEWEGEWGGAHLLACPPPHPTPPPHNSPPFTPTLRTHPHPPGRILNIAVCAADTREPSRLLNYLTAPNCLIWSAVACSSAFPFLFAPQVMRRVGRGGGRRGGAHTPRTSPQPPRSPTPHSHHATLTTPTPGAAGKGRCGVCGPLLRHWRRQHAAALVRRQPGGGSPHAGAEVGGWVGGEEGDQVARVCRRRHAHWLGRWVLPARPPTHPPARPPTHPHKHSEQFGCNFFLVSQCNPWLLPIIAIKRLAPRTLGTLLEWEFKHRRVWVRGLCAWSDPRTRARPPPPPPPPPPHTHPLPHPPPRRCSQLLQLWPHSRPLKLLCQPWEGDITMPLRLSGGFEGRVGGFKGRVGGDITMPLRLSGGVGGWEGGWVGGYTRACG